MGYGKSAEEQISFCIYFSITSSILIFSEKIRIMIKQYFPFLLLLVGIGACTDQQKEVNNDLLSQIRNNVLYNQLDAADSLLTAVDTLALNARQLHHFKLSKTYYLFNTGESEQSYGLLEDATQYYRRHGSTAEKAELALIWAFMLEVQYMKSEAFEEYLKAYQYFNQRKNSRLYFLNLLGLARTGVEQEEYLNLAEQYLLNNHHVRDQYLYHYTQSGYKDDLNYSLSQLKKCLHLISNDFFSIRDRYTVFSSLSQVYQILNKSDSSQFFNTKIYLDSLQLNIWTKDIFLTKAYINNKSNNLNASRKIIDQLLDKDFSSAFKAKIYLQKYGLENRLGNQKAALWALYDHAKEVRKSHSEDVSNKIALLTIRHHLQQKELQIRNHRLTIYIILLLSIILTMLLVFFFIRHRKFLVNSISAYKQKILDHNRQDEVKDRQLSELLQQKFDAVNGQEMNQGLEGFTGSDWHQFKTIFEAVHPYFTQKLRQRHPSLSTTDIRYCMCIYCDKDNDQAAEILSVTKDAVKKARAKLKMTFELNSIHEMGAYLQSIDKELSNGHGKVSSEK